jgi:hypothetical protein
LGSPVRCWSGPYTWETRCRRIALGDCRRGDRRVAVAELYRSELKFLMGPPVSGRNRLSRLASSRSEMTFTDSPAALSQAIDRICLRIGGAVALGPATCGRPVPVYPRQLRRAPEMPRKSAPALSCLSESVWTPRRFSWPARLGSLRPRCPPGGEPNGFAEHASAGTTTIRLSRRLLEASFRAVCRGSPAAVRGCCSPALMHAIL